MKQKGDGSAVLFRGLKPRETPKKKPGAPMRDAPGLMSIGAC
ncbi:hypothetical protein ACVINI_004169 [Rhizobium beringeri]|jgi:hypothetical protein